MKKIMLGIIILSLVMAMALLSGCDNRTNAVDVNVQQASIDMSSVSMGNGVAFIPIKSYDPANEPTETPIVMGALKDFQEKSHHEITSWNITEGKNGDVAGICITFK